MVEPPQYPGRPRAVLLLVFGCSVALAVAAIVLPSRTLAWLRRHYSEFNRPLSWLEHHSGPFNLVHVILFGWMVLLVSWLWPKMHWRRLACVLSGLAVISELVQILVPGRHARGIDVLDDLLGIVIGIALSMAGRRLTRSIGRGGRRDI